MRFKELKPMKKAILLSFLFCFFIIELSSQCQPKRENIRNNTRKNFITNNGMISNNDPTDFNGFFKDGDTQLFSLGYAKSFWLAGFDPSGNLKLSANTYPSSTEDDFTPGPLSRQTGRPIDDECVFYNRIWKVSAFEIKTAQALLDDGTITTSNIAKDILEWPAIGNPYIDADIEFEMAPFFDLDTDGIYDPIKGDIPIAVSENPSFLPFEFSFCVYNDVKAHTSSGGDPLQMEVQQINYLLNCEERPTGKSVFTRLKYIYLGSETLSDVRLSIWEDSDLGCFNNDFQGCNQDLNCVFYYNQDGKSSPDDQCFGNLAVPDDNGAIRTTVFLNKEMLSHIYFTNGVVGTSPPSIAGPTTPLSYYQYMDGKWRDGLPITIGGNGYNPASTDTTSFIYPDLPTDENGWSMQTANLPTVFDYRAVTTVSNQDLLPGSIGIIDIADYVLYDETQKNLKIFDQWETRILELKEDYEGIVGGSFNCGADIIPCVADCVWPGDVNRDGIVNGIDVVYDGVLVNQEIANGKLREIISAEWFPFDSEDWGDIIQDVDHKNGDVNGNGKINRNDVNLLVNNFHQTNANNTFKLEANNNLDPKGLRVGYNKEEISAADMQVLRTFRAEVNLGDENNELNEPLHGISYIMKFDTNLVRPFTNIQTPPLQDFDFKFSFTDNPEFNDNGELENGNQIDYAFSNLNFGDREAGGRTSTQLMTVIEGAKTNNPDGRDTLVIKLFNVFAMNRAGEIIDVGVQYDSLIITDLEVDPDLISSTNDFEWKTIGIQLFPNPVEENLNVQLASKQSGTIKILNAKGELIQSHQVRNEKEKRINLNQLETGLFVLLFENSEGRTTSKKFIKAN